jgi:signal peptidase II
MKGKHVALLIALVILADQGLKFYIKTHYFLYEEHKVFGDWFRLHFVENEGMAWGWQFGGDWGKLILTLFRFFAVVFGTFYLRTLVRKKYHWGFIVCASLIYAGALGNLIDSMFYGLIYNDSDPFMQNVAKLVPCGTGYAKFLHGKVVDMLYFPIIDTKYPSWFPYFGGQPFQFFEPVFNLADASISTGVIAILLWQRRFFPKHHTENKTTVETNASINDENQVS